MSFDYLKMEEGKFAISVHPPHGVSVYSSRVIERENPKIEITESEIENAISQAIWKLFDEERMFFSKRLDLSEMDVVMADVRVLYIKLDRGIVINPIGFTAKNIEIGLVEVLITRDLSDNIKVAPLKKGEVLFTMEPTASCAWLIQKDSKKKDFIIAKVAANKTFLYKSMGEGQISYISDFDWGANCVFDFISQHFGVRESIARDIFYRYARENMSENMRKNLKNVISEPFASFSKGVTLAARNAKITKPILYVLSDEFGELDSKHITWKESGVKINFLPPISYTEIASHEISGCDLQSPWNRIAKRRMKWLMCHK